LITPSVDKPYSNIPKAPLTGAKIVMFDQHLAYWWNVEYCQQFLTVEYVDNTKCRTPFIKFIAADGDAKTQI